MSKVIIISVVAILLASAYGIHTSINSNKNDLDNETIKINDNTSINKNDERIKISGHIHSHVEGEIFNFKRKDGRIIKIHIDMDKISDDILYDAPATIHGKVINVTDQPARLSAEKIHYIY